MLFRSGVSGAGKSTFIKHILGLLTAETGSIRVFGMDPVRDLVPVLRDIGYLSEERDLPGWMRVSELMKYTAAYHPGWDSGYAGELLRSFGLDPRKKIKSLSKGMRAQAGLIAAVAHRPPLLLLDEPSSGLDAVARKDILNAIVRAVAEDQRTVLFSSHLLDEVERMSDYVALMHEGSVVLHGDLNDVKNDHHVLRIRFAAAPLETPQLEGLLSIEGADRSWTGVCNGGFDRVREELTAMGGEIVHSQNASLEEIFIARVGRKFLPSETN